jgi:hypothetical protein
MAAGIHDPAAPNLQFMKMAPIGPKRGTNEDRRVGAAFASQLPNPRHRLEPTK